MSMQQRANPPSRQGLLLVEAVLSTVVIAVGLVLISRALSGQLKAVETVEQYDTLLGLAQGKLVEFENEQLVGRSLPDAHEGDFDAPYAPYHWTIKTSARDDPADENGKPLTSAVVLTVYRTDRPSAAVQLTAIWPIDWFPLAWR